MDAVNTNAERQRRLRQRRKEAGLLDYRRAVTPEQAKALDALLASLNSEKSQAGASA